MKETIKATGKELTSDQLNMLAQFDRKAKICIMKMKRLHELMETAVESCRKDQLEKICIAMNICVVDGFHNLVDEYANLMLRIFVEDEELTAQLQELTAEDFEEEPVEIKPESEEIKTETTTTESETPTRPLTWYETITGYFYGYGTSSGSNTDSNSTTQPKGE